MLWQKPIDWICDTRGRSVLRMEALNKLRAAGPGLALTVLVAVGAVLLEAAEARLLGRPWLEALVLAILSGALARTVWTPPRAFDPGIHFAAKTLLELAIILMGATVSFGAMAAVGAPLMLSIVGTVVLAIAASFLIGRLLGLPTKMAMLVACGNAICGNSAIAAVAPVIDADGEEVATSIAFTAVLGVAVVIVLPLMVHRLGLSPMAGGVLAGLTVYAVPQVLAAAGPMGSAAVQLGALVKLVRVLMLGPVVTGLAVLGPKSANSLAPPLKRIDPLHLLPPFIIGFLVLAGLNSAGLLPHALVLTAHKASLILTIIAMAGLGLGVDLRSVKAAGPRVILVVTASLVLLSLTALAMLRLLKLS